jgi:glucosamine--fructose-6-phosphate aminotransferase (isomerizing)
MLGNIQEVKARGGSVIALATEGHDTLKSVLNLSNDALIALPPVPESLSPIATVLPLQLLAYYIAVRRGCDVDQPRNLAKSVTVE